MVVRWANKLANGEDLWDFSGGDETNSFLETKGFVIRPKRAKTDLHSALYDVFPRIWRCAVSGSWAVIRKEKLLSFEDFDPGRNYREHPIEEGRGKKNITPWVNELQSGDLIFLLDKQHFYGFAIARSNYNFEGPFLTLKDSKQPAIKIELLYEAEKPVEGAFSYMRVPATFSSFGRAGFKLDVVLSILEKEEPQAIERLRRLVQMSAQNETYEILNNSDSMTTHALNTILYGPPGTGKTYTTIEKALRILNEKEDIEACESMARATIKAQYDKRMKEGRIEFVTFHQSMSYEDFIEGIKPVDPEVSGGQIQYKVELGIFRKICQRASQQSHLENFDSIFDKMVDELVESGGLELKTKSQNKTFRLTVNSARNLVPIPQTEAQSTSMVVTKDHIRGFLTRESERWKPYTAAICDYLTARYQLSIAQEDNRNKPFVLIIDEINRGNIAQIFGELITLIEEDKRLGKNESLEITLRYSKNRSASLPTSTSSAP
ncbi:MAG: ATP-binding protein [Saprospirales bacterium]|nr:ATP-binding protein [Saprospirales bacterium]